MALTAAERAEIRRYRRRGLAAPDEDIHIDGIIIYTSPRGMHRDLGIPELADATNARQGGGR